MIGHEDDFEYGSEDDEEGDEGDDDFDSELNASHEDSEECVTDEDEDEHDQAAPGEEAIAPFGDTVLHVHGSITRVQNPSGRHPFPAMQGHQHTQMTEA